MFNIERVIIADILSEPQYAGTACEIVSSDMFSGAEREIFKVIEQANERGDEVDLFLISKKANLEPFGGLNLSDIVSLTTNANNLKEHCFLLKEGHIKKTLLKYSQQISALIENKEPTQAVLDFTQKGLEDIFELTSQGLAGFRHISEITEKAIQKAEERVVKRNSGESIGIPTGLRALDALLHYFSGGQLIILGGRAAMGKTSVMLHLARSAAFANYSVCMYQLEMSAVALGDRMLFSLCDVDVSAYKTGQFQEWDKITSAQQELSKLPIYIDDRPKVSLAYIRNHARIMAKKGKCDIIFIDYLQLVDAEEKKNREQEVAKITRQCKILAKELNIPVVLLAQLNREVEQDKLKRPELRHLRESGAIEQDADIVMFCYRAAYYGIDSIEIYSKGGRSQINSEGIMEIIVAKNRDGGIGDVAFRHNENLTQLTNLY